MKERLGGTDDNGPGRKAGVKRQFFGCVLLCLGILDVMFDMKTGSGADFFTITLVATGAIILASGIISSKK